MRNSKQSVSTSLEKMENMKTKLIKLETNQLSNNYKKIRRIREHFYKIIWTK